MSLNTPQKPPQKSLLVNQNDCDTIEIDDSTINPDSPSTNLNLNGYLDIFSAFNTYLLENGKSLVIFEVLLTEPDDTTPNGLREAKGLFYPRKLQRIKNYLDENRAGTFDERFVPIDNIIANINAMLEINPDLSPDHFCYAVDTILYNRGFLLIKHITNLVKDRLRHITLTKERRRNLNSLLDMIKEKHNSVADLFLHVTSYAHEHVTLSIMQNSVLRMSIFDEALRSKACDYDLKANCIRDRQYAKISQPQAIPDRVPHSEIRSSSSGSHRQLERVKKRLKKSEESKQELQKSLEEAHTNMSEQIKAAVSSAMSGYHHQIIELSGLVATLSATVTSLSDENKQLKSQLSGSTSSSSYNTTLPSSACSTTSSTADIEMMAPS